MNNESIEIYMDFISQPSRAVLTLCKLGKIHTQINIKRLFKGEHLNDEVTQLNPLWSLPFIIDYDNNDFRLTESHAIMKYLLKTRSDNFSNNLNLYPKDPLGSAKIDEYLDWHSSNSRKTAAYILSITVPGSENIHGFIKDKLDIDFFDSLLTINHYFLKEGQFIGGMKEISIADLSAYNELLQLLIIDFDFSPYKNICTWMKNMSNIKEVNEVNKEFISMLSKILKKKDIKPRF